MVIAQEMLTTSNGDPDLLKKVITGDESSIYGYDIETKAYFAMTEKIKKKSKQEVLNDTKQHFSEMFRELIIALT